MYLFRLQELGESADALSYDLNRRQRILSGTLSSWPGEASPRRNSARNSRVSAGVQNAVIPSFDPFPSSSPGRNESLMCWTKHHRLFDPAACAAGEAIYW